MGYVAHIPGVYLLISLCDVNIKFCGVLQFKDAERYAIDKEQYIGNAHIVLHAVCDLKLIDNTENITVCIVKVDKTNIEILTVTVTGITVTVTDKLKGVAQTLKVGLSWNVAQIVDYFGDIAVSEIRITILQIDVQIVDIKVFDKQ